MKLPKGVHVKPEKIENFFQICHKLESDFTGALRLKGVKDHGVYIADLLIDLGNIIAASFKYIDSKPLYREEALEFIQKSLAGSSGKLDVFHFDSEEMARSIEANPSALLEEELTVSELGVKIKSKIIKRPGVGLFSKISQAISKTSVSRKEGKIRDLKSDRKVFVKTPTRHEIDFGSKIKPKEEGEKSELKTPANIIRRPELKISSGEAVELEGGKPIPLKTPITMRPEKVKAPPVQENAPEQPSMDRKAERLQKLKDARLQKIGDRISIEKGGEKTKTIATGVKVKTTIDKLYEMILDKGVVRLNDGLAKKLGVSKTQVEEWAMILEEHNLVELHYPALGEPELRKMHDK